MLRLPIWKTSPRNAGLAKVKSGKIYLCGLMPNIFLSFLMPPTTFSPRCKSSVVHSLSCSGRIVSQQSESLQIHRPPPPPEYRGRGGTRLISLKSLSAKHLATNNYHIIDNYLSFIHSSLLIATKVTLTLLELYATPRAAPSIFMKAGSGAAQRASRG